MTFNHPGFLGGCILRWQEFSQKGTCFTCRNPVEKFYGFKGPETLDKYGWQFSTYRHGNCDIMLYNQGVGRTREGFSSWYKIKISEYTCRKSRTSREGGKEHYESSRIGKMVGLPKEFSSQWQPVFFFTGDRWGTEKISVCLNVAGGCYDKA